MFRHESFSWAHDEGLDRAVHLVAMTICHTYEASVSIRASVADLPL